MTDRKAPVLTVMDLDNPSPEPFAVISVDLERRHPGGGCFATVVSLHMTREEADLAAAGGTMQ